MAKKNRTPEPIATVETQPLETVSVLDPVAPACKVCGSSKFSNEFETNRLEHDGNLTVWKSRLCECGQRRIDRIVTPLK